MYRRATSGWAAGLVGGAHIDYMEGGNALIQTLEYVVSGFSKRENIDAAGLITAGWVNDMFAPDKVNGIYGVPAQSIPIDTPTGVATAVVLPLGPAGPSPIGPIFDPLLNGVLNFLGEHLGVFEPLAGSTVTV
jgi:hypothetical protein